MTNLFNSISGHLRTSFKFQDEWQACAIQPWSYTDQSRIARGLFIASATTAEKSSQASDTSTLSTMLTVSNHNDGPICDADKLLKIQYTQLH